MSIHEFITWSFDGDVSKWCDHFRKSEKALTLEKWDKEVEEVERWIKKKCNNYNFETEKCSIFKHVVILCKGTKKFEKITKKKSTQKRKKKSSLKLSKYSIDKFMA
jgi:hypothetical protein